MDTLIRRRMMMTRRGRKIIWNQLFTNSSVTRAGVPLEYQNGVLTVAGTMTSKTTGYSFGSTVNLVNGHKYLHQVSVITFSKSSDAYLRSRIRDGTLLTYSATTKSAIFSATSDQSQRLGILYGTAESTYNIEMYQGLFDLTLMFGAGNEPSTVAEFDALFPLNIAYPYNAGEERYI